MLVGLLVVLAAVAVVVPWVLDRRDIAAGACPKCAQFDCEYCRECGEKMTDEVVDIDDDGQWYSQLWCWNCN